MAEREESRIGEAQRPPDLQENGPIFEGLSRLGSLTLLIVLRLSVLGLLALSQRIRWFLECQAPRGD
jgi:hypothetical protein